jgi:hypothetical protein
MKLRKAFVLCCVSVALSGCIPRDDSPYPYHDEAHCFMEKDPAIADRHAGTYEGVVCVVTSDTIIDTLSVCHITFGDHKDMHIYSSIPANALAKLTTSDEDKDAFENSKDSFSLKLGYDVTRWQGETKDPLYSYDIEDWKGSMGFIIRNHVYKFSFSIKQKRLYDAKFSGYKYDGLPVKGFSFKYITITKDGENIPLEANKELTVLGEWL